MKQAEVVKTKEWKTALELVVVSNNKEEDETNKLLTTLLSEAPSEERF